MNNKFAFAVREVKKNKAHTCPSAKNMVNHVAHLKEQAWKMFPGQK